MKKQFFVIALTCSMSLLHGSSQNDTRSHEIVARNQIYLLSSAGMKEFEKITGGSKNKTVQQMAIERLLATPGMASCVPSKMVSVDDLITQRAQLTAEMSQYGISIAKRTAIEQRINHMTKTIDSAD